MAGETGQSSADLVEALQADPAAFDFFQALRILLRHQGAQADAGFPANIRVRPDLGVDFPESDVVSVSGDASTGYELTATFLGLYGVSSPLPAYFNELLLDEEWEDEHAARGFLDIVHNHLYPLLYAAWLKHRFADNAIELGRDDYWELLFGMAGLRQPEMREAIARPGRLLRYLGLLLQHPRSALGLQTIVADLLDPIAVNLVPCVERWVKVPEPQRLRVGISATLGSAIIGAQMQDRMGRFQLRIGPLSGTAFQELVGNSERMAFVKLLVQFYLLQPLECELVFDITGESVLPARLGGDAWSRLGHDAWLRSQFESPPVSVRMMV